MLQVRRRVFWRAPDGSAEDEAKDFRPSRSRACFYAFDQYRVTNDPFYCVDIEIIPTPTLIPQTLVRFECKQLLIYEPVTRRYCFDDRAQVTIRRLSKITNTFYGNQSEDCIYLRAERVLTNSPVTCLLK